MTALAIFAFIAALLGSIMFHEWGHFAAARRFGMKATQFFVGFGPTIWSVRRGETEYGVKAIPAGGFVRISGMTPSEPLPEEDQSRAFYRQPASRRAVVLAAGSAMHMVLAVVLIIVALTVFGTATASTTIDEVSECLPEAGTECTESDPASPAAAAGLRSGDQVLAVDGREVEEWSDFTAVVRESADTAINIDVDRAGSQLSLTATPAAVEREVDGAATTIGVIGLTPTVAVERSGPVEAVTTAASGLLRLTSGTFAALVSIPSKVPELFGQTFGGQPRGVEDLVGPVGIAQGSVAILSEELPLSARIADFLLLIAGLNVFIGWFNILPLLPLDGGHLAVLGYERWKVRRARKRGSPDPGPVDVTRFAAFAYVFLFLLVGLSLLLLTADIVNPVDLGL